MAIESATAEFKSLDSKRQQMEVQKATCTPQLDAVQNLAQNQAMEAKLRDIGFATEALRRRQIDE